MNSSMNESLQQAHKKIEQQAQEIHELKLSLRTKSAIEQDYKQELQVVQQELKEETQKREDHVAKVKASLVKQHKQKESEFEAVLEEKSNLCSQLEATICDLKASASNSEGKRNDADVAALKADLSECRRELECMSEQSNELQSKCEALKLSNSHLTAELEELKELHSHSKERCNELREENTNLKEELERMQEDIQSMQFEISTLKNQAKPSDSDSKETAAQGNSLFTEVEDFRQAAMDRLKRAVEQEAQAKDELARCNVDLQRMRLQFAKLHEQFDKFQKTNLEYLDGELKERHEKIIQELEKRIFELEDQAVKHANQTLPPASTHYDWLQKKLGNYQKEVNDLNGKLHEARMNVMFNESSKVNCLRQERYTMAENMKLKGQLEELTLQIESLKNNKSPIKLSNTNVNVAPGIENRAPSTKPVFPWETNQKAANGKQEALLRLSKLGIGNNNMMQAKTKREPKAAPTLRFQAPTSPAPSADM